jgi:hypothetical protein
MHSEKNRFMALMRSTCSRALEKNNFSVYHADDTAVARNIVLKNILPKIIPIRTVSWGDSITLHTTGLLDHFFKDSTLSVIKTFDPTLPREALIERRREALLSDLFLSGTNAVTLDGKLVNLDMVGNRVAGITFGPRHVIIFVGANKIVPDLDAAFQRIRSFAAPANALRHNFKTPCTRTGRCMDCSSPQRICNVWSIIERSWPPGRIHVVLIMADLGL